MEKPRSRPRRTRRSGEASDHGHGHDHEDDDDFSAASSKVSWDELGDALNVGRRQSLVAGPSAAASVARALSNSTPSAAPPSRSHSEPAARPGGRGFGRGLPTILASGKSTRNFDCSGDDLDVSVSETSYDPCADNYNGDNARCEVGGREGWDRRGPTKLNHSLRPDDDAQHAQHADPVESWDDLQDVINTAMRESMMGCGPDDVRDLQELADADLSSQGSDGGGGEGGRAWNCPACTFLNEDPLHLVCAICGTAKVAGKGGGNRDKDKDKEPLSALQAPRRTPPITSHSFGQQSLSSLQSSFKSNVSGDDVHHRSFNHVNYSDDTNFNNSFQSNGRGEAHFRHSTGSVTPDEDGQERLYQGRRRGKRRGNLRNQDKGGKGGLGSSVNSMSSMRSSNREITDDGFEGFNLGECALQHSNRPRGDSMGGGGGASRRGLKMHRSVSSGERFGRRHNGVRGARGGGGRDRGDDHSRCSRASQRRSKKDLRRSSGLIGSFGGGSVGVGYGSHEDSYDSDDGRERLGSAIDASEHDPELDCSDLSEDETLFRDDRTERTMRTIKTLKVPQGEVTIIYTDVQGSTALWEADPLAMKKGTDIHDSIIRKCYADHSGYEITTEGDAFNMAFQHPADAIGFAIKAQINLYRAKWPEGILNHPDGCYNEKKKFRGFRVRFGMHHGPTTSNVHETTGRTTYQGEAVNIAKAIEKMSHGGQILTTVETWRAVSGMAEQFLGSPQVMDCGEHLLYDPKKETVAAKKKTRRIISKRIVQLVPNGLSYDFFAARGGQEVKEGEQPARVCGRVFPPLLSHGQLSTSFLNAPYIGNKVAMVFVYTDKMEAATDKERRKNYKILAKYVRSHLMRLSPPGYECQEDKGSWMLAFDRVENGIRFGLDLKGDVVENSELFGTVDKERVFRVGIHWGPFLSMGPHTVSGHADYFGPIVNRAARVAAQCEPGQVCVGVPMGDGEELDDPGPSVDVDVLGVKQLKGISIEMAIFACRKRVSK